MMDEEKQQHIAYEAMVAGQEYIEPRTETFIHNMKSDLAKKIKDLCQSRGMDKLDNILVASIVLVTGEAAETVTTKLSDVIKALSAQGVDNIILATTFYNLDTKYLFGSNVDIEDKTFPRRLDKVTKLVESIDAESGTSSMIEVGFGLDWSKVNDWDWVDIIEPLNINVTGNQTISSLVGELTYIPKIIYTYCAIRGAAGNSTFDSMSYDMGFPFFEEQLGKVRYAAAFDNIGNKEGRLHYGIDLAAEAGLEIHAAADGIVSYAWDASDGNGGGNRVAIQHANGLYTVYMHMADMIMQAGQSVTRGQMIGHVGYTGRCIPPNADGAHLHFQVNTNINSNSKGSIDPARVYERLGAIQVNTFLGSAGD
jgi:hypothetical protein